jgi:1-acyl-sn-glycerol-3-phosphate acyltransferase
MINYFRTGWRLFFLCQYLLLIILTIPIIFSPLGHYIPKQRQIASRLYRGCYQALNIQLVVNGRPTQQPALWVCNHISWLDILILAGNNTLDFIAKSEVASWPVLGGIIRRTGTLFIERDNIFKAYKALPELQQRLQSGIPVLVFPEGTTTQGESVLPFKPMFYQAAIRGNLLIQPISIHYERSDGSSCKEVAFIDDDDFSVSFKGTLKQPKIFAYITYLPAMKAEHWHRKKMAYQNQQQINDTINKTSNKHSCY